MPDVVLVSMPFGNVFAPSIGLSLLKAGLERNGVTCRVRYFTLDFAQRVGRALYCDIADDVRPSVWQLPGEWIFARALFGARAGDERRYVDTVLAARSGWIRGRGEKPVSAARVARLLKARARAGEFITACLEELLRERPPIVGFSSVFQQHVASLALAERLKQAAPETFVVFGGANCEGVMGAETVRQFPFVDAAVSGEADLVFPELVRRVLAREPLDGLQGVRTTTSVAGDFQHGRFTNGPSVRDLDALPYPDYRDYFEQFGASRYAREWEPRIFFESSRGCWWGEKQHCTFCGLNGLTMAYRSKSPRRALEELAYLARRHPGCEVQVVDNILDMRYFDSVLPELAERAARGEGVELFYETKANLKKPHVRLLRAAGVTRIQPGIESFSDSVLALMRKGVSGLQNVQLLKWCKELGVEPYWNLLWGFPGEDPEEYARMAELVPLLAHLPPPTTFAGIRLDRFSPNFFDAHRLGFRDVEPLPAYREVYPLAPKAVANLAYHFAFRYADGRDVETYIGPLFRRLRAWKARHGESDLFVADRGRYAVVCDLRPAVKEPLTVLRGMARSLYLSCDGIADLRHLAREMHLQPDEVEHALEPLVARGLLLRQGTRYLALAVALGSYAPNLAVVKRFCALVRSLGRAVPAGAAVLLRALDGAPGMLAACPAGPDRERPRFPARRLKSLSASRFRLRGARELIVQLHGAADAD